MQRKESEQAPQVLSINLPLVCRHQGLISYRVTEKEHKAGKVRCVGCGSVIPDPYF